MNHELERIWKEAVVAKLKVLTRYLHGVTDKAHKNVGHDSLSPGRNLNPGPPEYESG
jgi:hypothetical protein